MKTIKALKVALDELENMDPVEYTMDEIDQIVELVGFIEAKADDIRVFCKIPRKDRMAPAPFDESEVA